MTRVLSMTYTAVHHRLRKARGPARAHRCVDCTEPAAEWSYSHADGRDPDELVGTYSGKLVRYSADLGRYEPRCKPCHGRLDHPTKLDVDQCAELYGQGLSTHAIGRLVGYTSHGVQCALRNAGVKLRPMIAGPPAAEWTNCARGHPLVAPNLVPSKRTRGCLACQRTTGCAWHARQRGNPWSETKFQSRVDAACDKIFGDLDWRALAAA